MTAHAELQHLPQAVATNVRRHCLRDGVASFRRQAEAKHRAANGALWLHAERAAQLWPALSHTGHFSSFHAISQNIHSYRELITNASSIRRFSSFPAVLAHWSTFLRSHCCTSANSGEA